MERIALEVALYINAEEASRSVNLVKETSKDSVVDKEVRESEEEVKEEIKESETLVEGET